MKKIIVRIDEWGVVTIQTEGFVGVECQDATRLLEVGLGQKTRDDPTPEMYLTPGMNLENPQ